MSKHVSAQSDNRCKALKQPGKPGQGPQWQSHAVPHARGRQAERSPGSAQGQRVPARQVCSHKAGPTSSQVSDSWRYMAWAIAWPQCTSGGGPGRERQLKCGMWLPSEVGRPPARLPTALSHPAAFHGHLIQGYTATPHQCCPPAQAGRLLLGDCTQGPHPVDLMVYLWSLIC